MKTFGPLESVLRKVWKRFWCVMQWCKLEGIIGAALLQAPRHAPLVSLAKVIVSIS